MWFTITMWVRFLDKGREAAHYLVRNQYEENIHLV